jgi:hypothetical protein
MKLPEWIKVLFVMALIAAFFVIVCLGSAHYVLNKEVMDVNSITLQYPDYTKKEKSNGT